MAGTAVIEEYLAALLAEIAGLTAGEVATYIPELGLADPEDFAISIATVDGRVYSVGCAGRSFTIQSVSKPFIYGEALREHGRDRVLQQVGVEPTGDAFNAIVLDDKNHRPFNPMVNAGAIATAELLTGADPQARAARMLDLFSRFAGRPLDLDPAVYRSELETGHRNRAIAWMMLNGGMLERHPDDVLDLYFRQCSVLVTTPDLAVMAATLAGHGRNPLTGEQVIGPENVRDVLSVMSNCGMYDYAGQWTYDVGLPAKSGVSGGIIAVVPGQLGLAVYSPRLDEVGNSVRGLEVCRRFAQDFGLHGFSARIDPGSGLRAEYRARGMASLRMRSAEERRLLAEAGPEMAVLELQGPLYFGPAERLARRAVELAAECESLVLDFRRVAMADGAAASLITRMAVRLSEAGCALVVTGVEGKASLAGLRGALAGLDVGAPVFLPDIDQALEAFEDRQLRLAGQLDIAADLPMHRIDLFAGLSPEDLAVLDRVTQTTRFAAGEVILRAGEEASHFYVIARGTASVMVGLEDGRRRRVASVGSGQAFGEMALLDGGQRSADVVADVAMVAHAVSVGALQTLGASQPHILTTILTNLARGLSARLRQATATIQVLGSG